MKPEWKRKWIEALRSGDYKQGKWQLKNMSYSPSRGYCCMGVLCDIYQAGHWNGLNFVYKNEEATAFLPNKLCRQLDIDPMILPKLAHLNDVNDYSFEQIADYIEQEL